MTDRTGSLVIALPEGGRLSFPLAGGVSRSAAWFLDVLCVATLTEVAGQVLAVTAVLGPAWQNAFRLLVFFVLSTGYPMYCEWRFNGQTIGKRLLRLRVMAATAQRLTVSQIVIRNLLRVVDMLPAAYLVGGAVAFRSRYGQRLGDIAAGTVVVRDEQSGAPSVPHVDSSFNSLTGSPHLIARLRHLAPRELIPIAAAAILRREQLAPAARVELFDAIRGRFARLAAFPEEAIEHLTSEQYVRNVLAALARRKSLP